MDRPAAVTVDRSTSGVRIPESCYLMITGIPVGQRLLDFLAS